MLLHGKGHPGKNNYFPLDYETNKMMQKSMVK